MSDSVENRLEARWMLAAGVTLEQFASTKRLPKGVRRISCSPGRWPSGAGWRLRNTDGHYGEDVIWPGDWIATMDEGRKRIQRTRVPAWVFAAVMAGAGS